MVCPRQHRLPAHGPGVATDPANNRATRPPGGRQAGRLPPATCGGSVLDMGELRVLPPGRKRTRPGKAQWTQAMNALLEGHEAHGCVPFHLLETVAESIGVAARSVETRYGQHLSAL